MPPENHKGYVTVGRFSDPYGVKGGIRLKSMAEKPSNLKGFKAFFLSPGEALALSFGKALKDGFVVTIDGIETPEAAKAFKGKAVFVKRENLPGLKDNEFYYADLEGLKAKTVDGEVLGIVTEVNNFGAGDVIEIALDQPRKGIGKTLLLPFKGEIVTAVDLKSGTLTVDAKDWLEE